MSRKDTPQGTDNVLLDLGFDDAEELSAKAALALKLNELIDQHNRWFPAEARLPMDPRTGDFVKRNGKSYRLELLDAGWVLARYAA